MIEGRGNKTYVSKGKDYLKGGVFMGGQLKV